MADQKFSETKQQSAKTQGQAYTQALTIMKEDVEAYASQEVDDYIVTLACEAAEGMYYPADKGSLKWATPDKNMNQHIEVAVQDRRDKRFIPSLELLVKVINQDGDVMYDDELPFLWHPFLWHYGSNLHIDGKGTYNFAITIKQPDFGRHDEQNGQRYSRTVVIDFADIHLTPGRSPHVAK